MDLSIKDNNIYLNFQTGNEFLIDNVIDLYDYDGLVSGKSVAAPVLILDYDAMLDISLVKVVSNEKMSLCNEILMKIGSLKN